MVRRNSKGGMLPHNHHRRFKLMIQDHKGRNYGVTFENDCSVKGLRISKERAKAILITVPDDIETREQAGGTKDFDDIDHLNWFEQQVINGFADFRRDGREAEKTPLYCVTDNKQDLYPQIEENFLEGLKAEGMLPIELRDKSPVVNARGERVRSIVISGKRDWYVNIEPVPVNADWSEVPTYWLALELRPTNPFFPPEEGCCTNRKVINHLVKILRLMKFIDIAEDEDQETEDYRDQVKILLFGGKKREDPDTGKEQRVAVSRWLPEGSPQWLAANAEECRVLPFEDEMEDGSIGYRFLTMPETDDWYEVQHRNFMKNRIRIEMRTTAEYCVKIFYGSILHFILGWGVFAVGMLEINGGDAAVMIASILTGITMSVGGSPFGFLASLSANELYLQRFMVVCLMTMSFLTIFLYVELKFTWDNNRADIPTTSQLGPTVDALLNRDENVAKNTAGLVITTACLFSSFINVYFCQQALDTINDLSSLQDDALVFRYFQVRFTEMKKTCEQMAVAIYGRAGFEGPRSMTEFWTRSGKQQCGESVELEEKQELTYQSPAISSGVIINSIGKQTGSPTHSPTGS
eukprot:TRINITY_DN8640_c0_g2_i1.p1 TRINITY_DN8640_c0_g2~~TRINITY_DN8640_c0_g2_i1.p1  ORF type:complete len:632 (+),score=260.90 TRINITY_DN8640_c0_g2_i1:160-1896(+)